MTLSPSNGTQQGTAEHRRRPRHSPPLDTTVTFRLSGVEKELLTFFAQTAGLSVGRFLVGLMKVHGEATVDIIRQHTKEAEALLPGLREHRVRGRPREPKLADLKRGLRIPFLQEKHAAPFLRAVKHAADQAGCEPYIIAWITSHLVEAIAREVASNEVVSIPGFMVVGPWRREGQGVCVPRFQASRAFCDYLLTDGSREGANRKLQAQRRRRRKKLMNLPTAQREYRVRVEAQSRRCLEALDALGERGAFLGTHGPHEVP